LSRAYTAVGNDKGVAAVTVKILERDPSNTNIRYNHGLALFKIGDYNRSHETFTHILKDHPEDTDVLFHAALSSLTIGNFGEALEYTNRLLDTDPSYRQLYLLRAQANLNLGELEDALSDIKRAEARKEADALSTDFLYYKAYEALGETEMVEDYCEQLARSPSMPDLIRNALPEKCHATSN
jgi:tetratricopeptide (TPR) repeat protein